MTNLKRRPTKADPPPNRPPPAVFSTPGDKPPPYPVATKATSTLDVPPTHDYTNSRFLRSRTHTNGAVTPPWYIVDLVDNTIAYGTDPAGYRDDAAALEAQHQCQAKYGAWKEVAG